ncbi:purpurin-like [Ylistrum balloti]|uniref:purpurin-like n=1 Tax=Ylistrum balloti TaxID=509963 RepID=UPI0029058858|nr:purpurin-like [Ylistrum balloti]
MRLESLILICLCLSPTIFWCYGHGYPDCDIDKFQVQNDLNVSRFEGYWYAISANREFNPFRVAMSTAPTDVGGMEYTGGMGLFSGFNVGMPRQTPWAAAEMRQIRNLQYYFEMTTENGTMRTLTTGAVMADRCYYAQGLNIPRNESNVAKTDYIFQGSKFPIWIIKTDYEGYALIYSCWNTNANGECSPGSSYVISLNRVMEGHTAAELAQVEAASTEVCVPPESLRPVFHDGGCAINATYFPAEEFSIMNDPTTYFPFY